MPKAKSVTFKCKPGKVAVAFQEAPPTVGEILLSDQARDDMFPDWGRVISSGVDELDVGDVVLAFPYTGSYVLNCHGFELVRFMGDESVAGESIPVPIDDHIVGGIVGRTLTPLKKNVLIALTEIADKQGEIYLPNSAKTTDGKARVIAVGSEVSKVKEGERVWISGNAIQRKDLGEDWNKAYGLTGERLAFIHEDSIYAGY